MEDFIARLSTQLTALYAEAETLKTSPDKHQEYIEPRKKLSAIIQGTYESALKEMCDRLDY